MTTDGNTVMMTRMTSGFGGNPSPGQGEKGPLLLLHGEDTDGLAWFERDAGISLPFQLHGKGYDVWVGNKRGTQYAPLSGSDQWEFDHDEVAEDATSMITTILQARADEGSPCDKVSIVTNSLSSAETLIMLNKYPTTAA